MMIELGDKVRDVVTGYEGVAVCFIRAMTGCDQFAVQSGKINADGKLSDSVWFDRHRLEITHKGFAKVPGCPPVPGPHAERPAGGPLLTH